LGAGSPKRHPQQQQQVYSSFSTFSFSRKIIIYKYILKFHAQIVHVFIDTNISRARPVLPRKKEKEAIYLIR
jgi:hypothetical protein